MSKGKTKKAIWDTECRETYAGSGVWEWDIKGRVWQYHSLNQGSNVTVTIEGKTTGVAFFRKLNDAVLFSWGYDAGARRE